jgi:Zn-dependent protease
MNATEVGASLQFLSAAAIPMLFGIALHEVAHGRVARLLGDRTAESLGRLSLNPLRHLDPVGTVLVPVTLYWLGMPPIGWAKPVPVNARNLRQPKRDMMLVAAAGPASNLLMALGWTALFLLLTGAESAAGGVREFALAMAKFGIQFNVLLAVFNVMPIPPLDGGRVLRGLVPETLGRKLDAIEPYGFIIVLGLFSIGILGRILSPVMALVVDLIFFLAGA